MCYASHEQGAKNLTGAILFKCKVLQNNVSAGFQVFRLKQSFLRNLIFMQCNQLLLFMLLIHVSYSTLPFRYFSCTEQALAPILGSRKDT